MIDKPGDRGRTSRGRPLEEQATVLELFDGYFGETLIRRPIAIHADNARAGYEVVAPFLRRRVGAATSASTRDAPSRRRPDDGADIDEGEGEIGGRRPGDAVAAVPPARPSCMGRFSRKVPLLPAAIPTASDGRMTCRWPISSRRSSASTP